MKSYLGAMVVALALYLVWDNFLAGMLIGPTLSAIPGMQAEYAKLWEIVGDVCATAILAGVYVRVRGVFGLGSSAVADTRPLTNRCVPIAPGRGPVPRV